MENIVKTTTLSPVSNGAKATIDTILPYSVKTRVEGTTPLLFHAWNVESVTEKAKAAKGSRAKKEDDVNSYVYRNEDGIICLPGEYFRQSIIHAAKYLQDPRSPRKSAMDLFKAGLLMYTDLAPLGKDTWDYLDQRRVVIQRNGINRSRPAFYKGWVAELEIGVVIPEYITRDILHAAVQNAGRLVGVGDFRPTYGRFHIVEFA